MLDDFVMGQTQIQQLIVDHLEGTLVELAHRLAHLPAGVEDYVLFVHLSYSLQQKGIKISRQESKFPEGPRRQQRLQRKG
jgi:hypothetical protein